MFCSNYSPKLLPTEMFVHRKGIVQENPFLPRLLKKKKTSQSFTYRQNPLTHTTFVCVYELMQTKKPVRVGRGRQL